MRDLPTLVQTLPAELFNIILKAVFEPGPCCVQLSCEYKPPAQLQVDRYWREHFAQRYYGEDRFVLPISLALFGRWARSLEGGGMRSCIGTLSRGNSSSAFSQRASVSEDEQRPGESHPEPTSGTVRRHTTGFLRSEQGDRYRGQILQTSGSTADQSLLAAALYETLLQAYYVPVLQHLHHPAVGANSTLEIPSGCHKSDPPGIVTTLGLVAALR